MADEHATGGGSEGDRGAGAWLLKAGAYAGAVTAIGGLAFAVVSKVSSKVSPHPPPALTATITNVAIEPNRTEDVYFSDHLASLRREERLWHEEHLGNAEIHEIVDKLGVVVEFNLNTTGPPGHAWTINETLYNHTTGAVVPNLEGNALVDYRYVPPAETHTRNFPSWIQYPSTPGAYDVEIEVNEGNSASSPIVRNSPVFHTPKT
jgi:hypothetical protein